MRWARGVAAAAVLSMAAFGPAFANSEVTLWNPSESYQGGKQYDSRLDRTVKLWRAGLTLEEAFAEIEQQTEVKLTFSPPEDANRDFPVHVFLSEQDPPTLRALMVQLAWVTDCVFAVEGEAGSRVYSLLHTSLGDGAEARLAKEREARLSARKEMPGRLTARLTVLREGLQLSREEAIRRYRGKDDFLLLTLLDPARRGAAEVVCGQMKQVQYPAFVTEAILERPGGVVVEVGLDLDPPRSTSRASLEGIREQVAVAFGLDPMDLPDDPYAAYYAVMLNVRDMREGLSASLSLSLASPFSSTVKERDGPREVTVIQVTDGPPLRSAEEVALRRFLGEAIAADQEAAFVTRRVTELEAQRAAREQQRRTAGRSLSRKVERALDAVTLPLTRPNTHASWQVLEAVAEASNGSIVADGMWWQEVPLGDDGDAASPLSALEALTALTEASDGFDGAGPAWEWGDAGRLLRFRTSGREVWRAARLPTSTIGRVDALLAEHLPKRDGADKPAATITLSLDPSRWLPALAPLSKLQTAYGGLECYGDPRQPAGVARHTILAELLSPFRDEFELAGLLFSFTPEQWQDLAEEGLECERDLNAQQSKLFRGWLRRREEWRMEGCRFRLSFGESIVSKPIVSSFPGVAKQALTVKATPEDPDSERSSWDSIWKLWDKSVSVPLPVPPQEEDAGPQTRRPTS